MINLFCLNKEINSDEGIQELDLNIDFKDWFKDIDNNRICCSTPTNKFNISGSSKCEEFSNYIIQNANLNTPKEDTNVLENSTKNIFKSNKIDYIDSEMEHKGSKDINSLVGTLVNDSNKKIGTKKDLSNRQDVVNKACLRHMRKYYADMFKRENTKIVRKRYCNIKPSEIMRAIKLTFNKELDNENLPSDFYYYIIGILKIKDVFRMNCSNQTKHEVFDFHDCCRNYSKLKYDALFTSKCLNILLKNFVLKNPSNKKYQLLIHKYGHI